MIDFAAEQDELAKRCWQFLGPRELWPTTDSWIRRTLFGRDVFVQRFGDELRGYSNICQHRGYPLRTADSGRGLVQCGFHGWQYNRDGIPTGIPRNPDLFGLSQEQKAALQLPSVRVESIGNLVFAARSSDVPPLVEYLGDIGDVFRTYDADRGPIYAHSHFELAANWKRHVEITLDDYHLEGVHPQTFGKHGTHALTGHVYKQHGPHSSMMWRRDAWWDFGPWWEKIRRGENVHEAYKIFNAFPMAYIASFREGCFASVATPLAEQRTRIDWFLWNWHDQPDDPAQRQAMIDWNYKVGPEDAGACEAWETAIHGFDREPIFGKLEERCAWFRDAYARMVGC